MAAFAPHAYCFQGINYKNVSSWTYQQKPLPFIRLKNGDVFIHMLACYIKNTPFGFTHAYRKGIGRSKNLDSARIQIENAKADILMFAGEEDNIWNALDGCTEIMTTLKSKQYPYTYKLITYKNAGHPFYAPYILPASATTEMKTGLKFRFSSGGTPQDNTHAMVDSWEKMLVFFTANK